METKNYIDAYIAFIDILGFKKIVEQSSCSHIYSIFASKFRSRLSTVHLEGNLVFDFKLVQMKVMSDSICFFVDAKVPNSLMGLVSTCLFFQKQLLEMDAPILTRGAIVRGDIFVEDDIVFGPGFVNAYLLEEKNAKTPRIIMTKEVIDGAKETTTAIAKNFVVGTTFRDDDAYYVVNYFEPLQKGKPDENTAQLMEHIDHVLDTVTDSSVREKYVYLHKNMLKWNAHLHG